MISVLSLDIPFVHHIHMAFRKFRKSTANRETLYGLVIITQQRNLDQIKNDFISRYTLKMVLPFICMFFYKIFD
jgi:hypothetical protein